jgi:hypothetical protein
MPNRHRKLSKRAKAAAAREEVRKRKRSYYAHNSEEARRITKPKLLPTTVRKTLYSSGSTFLVCLQPDAKDTKTPCEDKKEQQQQPTAATSPLLLQLPPAPVVEEVDQQPAAAEPAPLRLPSPAPSRRPTKPRRPRRSVSIHARPASAAAAVNREDAETEEDTEAAA